MIALNIRLKQDYTKSHTGAINIINQARKSDSELGTDLDEWLSLLSEVEKETGIKFNHKVSENGENIIEEEGYVEPTPDPMMVYNEDVATYSNIKATHELGLISDEELAESQDYMRSIYPSKVAKFRLTQKPEWFDKFRGHR